MTQTNRNETNVTGRYGRFSEGICLFHDGMFLLYGYATIVVGTYVLEQERIRFFPDKPDVVFSVYGRQNKHITNGIRVLFRGFERGTTFIQFDHGDTRRVFNERANCFSPPYVYDTSGVPERMTLFHQFDETWYAAPHNAASYELKPGMNEFVCLYHRPDYYHEPFDGQITMEEGVSVLWTTLTSSAFPKEDDPEGRGEEWEEIEALKANYKKANRQQDVLYATSRYRLHASINTTDYVYDPATDQYINNDVYEANTNYDDVDQNEIQADMVLRPFYRIEPAEQMHRDIQAEQIDLDPVFYSSCEDPERSYRYKKDKEEIDTSLYPPPQPPPQPLRCPE